MVPSAPTTEVAVRSLEASDFAEIVRIDGLVTGKRKPAYWTRVFADVFAPRAAGTRVGIVAASRSGLAGFLLGDVRAFEFGSEACGWVFAVGVDPAHGRRRVGSTLLAEASRRFRAAGVDRVRTMVRRTDVPMLSFFRASGFEGGPFVQLEHGLAAE